MLILKIFSGDHHTREERNKEVTGLSRHFLIGTLLFKATEF